MSVKSLVRSTLLLGSSSAANTVVGVARVKVLALLVGPAGLGLLGTLSGLAGVGTTLFALGADTSGTRRLALGRDDPAVFARLRRTLLLIGALHGLASVGVFWALRHPLSHWLFGSEAYASQVGYLGLAVAFSLLAGLQIALLQGLGRVADIARIGVASSLIGTIGGVGAVYAWGLPGLIVLILAQPLLAALLACGYARRVSARHPTVPTPPDAILAEWRNIVCEGAPFMVSYLMLALVPLAVRVIVIHDLGLEAAGHFHAAWTMSVIYVGFLLNAMSADYFPRLTGLIGEPGRAIALVNTQTQVGLAIGGPILLLMLAGAPWIVPLLYSKAFAPAAGIVEWQAFGNLMKIAGWPVAFLSMARGRSLQFLVLEFLWTSLYFAGVWMALPHLGLEATGMAFAGACGVFFLMQTAVAWATFGFKWHIESLALLGAYAVAGAMTMLAARHSAGLQAAVGCFAALAIGLAGLRMLLAKIDAGGRLALWLERLFASLGRPFAAVLALAQR